MGRYLGPSCRLCRREGIKLMLKGIRCETAKCPMEKQYRNKPPGMQGWRRGRGSTYGVRLREKQKVKRYYGLFESQFRKVFQRAARTHGKTGDLLLSLLERRLDNVVYKLGFAMSRKSARVMIGHGHIRVNGRRLDRPSYTVRQGDTITVKPSDRSQQLVRELVGSDAAAGVQPWLKLDVQTLTGTVAVLPTRDDVQIPVEEQLIVELCTR